jgi:S-adenosylmethionine uptake transporter
MRLNGLQMLRKIVGTHPGAITGMVLSACGYTMFAIQDALVKWLVASYAVPEILFIRSVAIAAVAAFFVYCQRQPSILKSPNRRTLFLRTFLVLGAWLLYYSATRHLALAQLTTLYFSAPLIVIFLSIVILKEKVTKMRWMAAIVGLVGVVIAANPANLPELVPAATAVFAAFCWAWSVILVRLVSRTESTISQMMATSLVFAVACAAMMPWFWTTPDLAGWALLALLSVVGMLGQFLVYEGFRYAPASSIAPIEYSGLIWAVLFGFIIWGEIPTIDVYIGAVLVVGSSLGLIAWERRSTSALKGS